MQKFTEKFKINILIFDLSLKRHKTQDHWPESRIEL
jgi:hypothetical protein